MPPLFSSLHSHHTCARTETETIIISISPRSIFISRSLLVRLCRNRVCFVLFLYFLHSAPSHPIISRHFSFLSVLLRPRETNSPSFLARKFLTKNLHLYLFFFCFIFVTGLTPFVFCAAGLLLLLPALLFSTVCCFLLKHMPQHPQHITAHRA